MISASSASPQACRRLLRACAGAIAAFAAAASSAQTITWNDSNIDFNASGSWTRSSGSGAPGSSEVGRFTDGSPSNQPRLDANHAVGGLYFGSTTGAWTFTGTGSTRTLTIGSSGIVSDSGNTQTFNNSLLGITISANTAFTANGAGGLNFGSTLASFSLSTFTLTLNGTGTSANNIISEPVSGSGGITKSGTGTWTLAGANSYSGVTTVSGGILQVSDVSNYGAAGNLGNVTAGTGAAGLVLNGGTLKFTGGNDSTNRLFTLGTSGGTIDASGTTTSGNRLQFTGTGNVVASGTGNRTLTLTGTNTNENSLAAGIVNPGTGATSVTKDGAGTWVLGGNSTYSGGTNLLTGSLGIGHNNALGTGTLAISSGSTLYASGATRSIGNAVTTSGNFTIGGSNDLTLSGSLNLGGTARTITVSNSGTTTFSGVVGENWNTAFTKEGTGRLVLSNANTFTGAMIVNAGTLALTHSSALGAASTWGNIVANGATLELSNNIAVNEGGFTVTGTGLSSAGAIRNLSGNNSLAGQIVLGSGGATINSTAGTLTLSGQIDNAGNQLTVTGAGNVAMTNQVYGNGGVLKTGAGTLTLSGSNSYNGSTTINAGTVLVGANVNLGNTPASPSAANITLGGGSLTATESFALDANRGTTLTSATTSNITAANTKELSYGGVITGAGNITFGTASTGTGTVTLSGTNTNTGTVQVSAGTLKVQSNGALAGSAGTTVSSGATLQIDGGQGSVQNGTLTLNGTGASGAGGALVGTSGNNRWAGNITLGSNTTISNSNSSGYLALGVTTTRYNRVFDPGGTPTDPHTLNLNGFNLTLTGSTTAGDNRAIYVNSRITGTGGVIVDLTDSADMVRYTANLNTYTGLTQIKNGELSLATLYNTFPNDPAHPNYFAINGAVQIGDGTGAAGSARLSIQVNDLALYDEMMSFTTPVSIFSDGQFSLKASQTIGTLAFTGGAIDLGTTGSLYLNGDVTVNASAGNTATITGTGSSGMSLTMHQDGDIGANATRTFNVIGGVGNASDLTIDAKITDGSIVKTGDGIMTIKADTDYEGTTTVSNGILSVQHSGALGQADNTNNTATTVNSGGTLRLDNSANGNLTISGEKLTLNGTGEGNVGALQNLAGNNEWAGAVVVNNARIQSEANTLKISGGVTINTALDVRGDGNTTVSGAISGAGTIAKSGTGTLTVSGNNSYGGATTVSGGVLSVQSSTGLGNATTGTTVQSGGALHLDNTAVGGGANFISIGSEALSIAGSGTGTGALFNAAGNNTYGGLVTVADNARIGAASGTTMTMTGGATSSAGNTKTLTIGGVGADGNVTISGNLSLGAGFATAVNFTKEGSGNVTFSGTTGTVGATALSAGTMTVGGTTTLTTGAFSSVAGTTLTIASGGTINANYASGSTTFSGAMAGSGTFNKAGAGTMVMNNGFTASGLNLKLSGGTMMVQGGDFAVDTLTLAGGTLSLMNSSLTANKIHITGNTILDFNNSAGTFLSSAELIIDAGVTVTINNWISVANNAAASTAWYATSTINAAGHGPGDTKGGTPLNQVSFTGYPGWTTTWVNTDHNGWFDDEIRPTPEPATYGAIFLSASLGLLAWRRMKRARAARA